MKILTLFIDMLRTDFLSSYNSTVKKSEIDLFMEEMKGTLFTNCFTNGPDTPRSLSSFWSGISCLNNGCKRRTQYPRYFLRTESFLSRLQEHKFKLCFSTIPSRLQTGILPPDAPHQAKDAIKYDLDTFLNNFELDLNSFVFIDICDSHWAINDWGANYLGVRKGHEEVSRTLQFIRERIDIEAFDIVILFSDHGHLIDGEGGENLFDNILQPKRSRVLMFWHRKGDESFQTNDKLSSMTDVYPTLLNACGIPYNEEKIDGIDLFDKKEHEYICMEDSFDFAPLINLNLDIWGVITKDSLYCTTLKREKLFWGDPERDYRKIIESECPDFVQYSKEQQVFDYYKTLKAPDANRIYTNGRPRRMFRSNKLIARIQNKLVSLLFAREKDIFLSTDELLKNHDAPNE